MKQQTRRALERLLAVPPLPADPVEIFAWAGQIETERRRLAVMLVWNGYGERTDDGTAVAGGG